MKARDLTSGDLFSLPGQWLVIEVSRYSDGDVIIYANSDWPFVQATFTLKPEMELVVPQEGA